MRLEGRTYISNKILNIHEVDIPEDGGSFVENLEKALVELCRQMEIPVPMWLKKNTKEFAAFHQTIFFAEQYTDKVVFDKFQIKMIDM